MLTDLREALRATPFTPFTIEMSDGRRFRIRTGDHAFISPRGTVLYLYPDDEHVVWVSPNHVTTVEFDQEPRVNEST